VTGVEGGGATRFDFSCELSSNTDIDVVMPGLGGLGGGPMAAAAADGRSGGSASICVLLGRDDRCSLVICGITVPFEWPFDS
jgi:hypothetical protein